MFYFTEILKILENFLNAAFTFHPFHLKIDSDMVEMIDKKYFSLY